MRNFIRINNYYNRLEAVNDWLKLCREVVAAGKGDLAVKHAPPEGAGWRKIDKHIAALRKEFEATQHITALDASPREAQKDEPSGSRQ